MPKIRSYRDLTVWQKSLDLVDSCYSLSAKYPPVERFGLTSQIRRSAVSIPANIAEGHSRESTREYLRHVSIARASLRELETLLIISQRLGFLGPASFADAERRTDEIGRMLTALSHSLESRIRQIRNSDSP